MHPTANEEANLASIKKTDIHRIWNNERTTSTFNKPPSMLSDMANLHPPTGRKQHVNNPLNGEPFSLTDHNPLIKYDLSPSIWTPSTVEFNDFVNSTHKPTRASEVVYLGKGKRDPKPTMNKKPTVGGETDGTSSPSVERNTKGDELQQGSGKPVAISDVTTDEVLRLLGESFPSGVNAAISVFHEWLACLSESEKVKARKDLRLLVLRAFRKMWFSPPDTQTKHKRFLSHGDYDLLVKRSTSAVLCENEKQQLLETKIGISVIELLGRCCRLNWISVNDILLATVTLGGKNYTNDGYSHALYKLLESAGDRICNTSCEGKTCEMVDDLSEMVMWGQITREEDIDFHGKICRLVDYYGDLQRKKYALAAPSEGGTDNRAPRPDVRRMLHVDRFDPFGVR